MFSGYAVLWWLPTAAVAAMSLLGLVAAAVQPARPAKNYWLAALLLCGVVAIVVSAWVQKADHEQAVRLAAVWGRLGEVQGLPPIAVDATPDQIVEAVGGAIDALNGKIKDLNTRLAASQVKAQARTISDENGAKLTEFLHQTGSHRVVVSCVPDDVEAFEYANRIANLLRQAGWDALGPETTTIFGEAPAMGVTLYVRGTNAPPDTAKLLLDAFTRFNIPYQSGIMPSTAIPDPATVEVFVGRKP